MRGFTRGWRSLLAVAALAVVAATAPAGRAAALPAPDYIGAVGWGEDAWGRLGDGTTTWRYTPVAVVGLTGVTDIDAGQQHTVALRADGTVWAWGANRDGELGDGTTQILRTTPVRAVGVSNARQVSAGYDVTLAVRYAPPVNG